MHTRTTVASLRACQGCGGALRRIHRAPTPLPCEFQDIRGPFMEVSIDSVSFLGAPLARFIVGAFLYRLCG